MQCEVECLSPGDCWQREPEVLASNAEAWATFKLFDTQFEWGAAGYRVRYDIDALQTFVIHAGATPLELLGIVERVKVIEEAVLSAEGDRAELDREEAERRADQDANRPGGRRR